MGHSSITIVGNLGADPESRQAGTSSVVELRVAVTTGFGQREVTTWYRASIWGKPGENAMKMLKKGTSVAISGEFFVREYGKKDGSIGYSPEIGNARWAFAGPKGDIGGGSGGYSKPSRSSAPVDTDIPF